MKRYNLIDRHGRVAYASFPLERIRQLTDANGYTIIYADEEPASIVASGCCGPIHKIYAVVRVQTKNSSSPHFDNICAELSDLYARKNQDYGDSFHKTFKEYGSVMAAIRLEDKLNRFKRLIKNESAVKDESVADTLKDLANYAIMTLMELSGDEPKDDESDKEEEAPQQDPSTRYNILDAISRKIVWKRYTLDDIQYMVKRRGWVLTYNVNNEPVNIYINKVDPAELIYTVEVSTEDD